MTLFKTHFPALGLALFCSLSFAQSQDPRLLGCWRAQNSDQYMPDKKMLRVNRDCVTEFAATTARSECRYSNGERIANYTFKLTAPGRYRLDVTDVTPPSRQPVAGNEVDYVVDGDWLLTTVVPLKAPNATQAPPDKIVSLWVKVAPSSDEEGGGCHPRGPSKLRVGRAPESSLALTVPEGFAPILQDPTYDAEMAQTVSGNYVVGQFAPAGFAAAATSAKTALESGGRYVLVLEDFQIGSRVVKAADFSKHKEMLKADIGRDKVSCEDEKKICFDLNPAPDANQRAPLAKHMTTQFVNVKGRVVIVYSLAIGPSAEAAKIAKRMADTFADRLLQDNP